MHWEMWKKIICIIVKRRIIALISYNVSILAAIVPIHYLPSGKLYSNISKFKSGQWNMMEKYGEELMSEEI